MVKYEELLESNIGSNNKVETINKTLHNLNSLFKASGCDEQICEIIEGKLPTSVKGNALVSLLKIIKTHFYRNSNSTINVHISRQIISSDIELCFKNM